jgi:nucleoid-associated protein YgaU
MHYTIRPGDSLSDIANRFYLDRDELFHRNRGTLDATAISHGYQSSNNGTLIFPGTTINVGEQSWI